MRIKKLLNKTNRKKRESRMKLINTNRERKEKNQEYFQSSFVILT